MATGDDYIVGGQIVGYANRRDRVNYYLDLAETVSENSTCLHKHWGAIIVSEDDVISTGYTGAPRGRQNCDVLQQCFKDHWSMCGNPQGTCRAVHAEANAIISARRKDMKGSSLYLVGIDIRDNEYVKDPHCCKFCKMLIINAGIRDVFIRLSKTQYIRETVLHWVDDDDTLEDPE